MKLRLFGDTIRFRVRRQDIAGLVTDGFLEKTIRVGPSADDLLAYRLELVEDTAWDLRPLNRGLAIAIPFPVVRRWADSDTVGMSFTSAWGTRVLIEKDFPCLEPRSGETDEGTFARPSGDPVRCTANE